MAMRIPKNKVKSFSLLDKDSNVKKWANKQESKVAKALGARQTINSGVKLFDPADMKLGNNLIELKNAKDQKQIIVTVDMLKKLLAEASRVGKDAVLVLNFPNSDLRIKKWMVLPYDENSKRKSNDGSSRY